MIYGYGTRVDNDSNAITVIDEENRTAETKGYINGEYVEFSGGSDFSEVQVTLVNNSADFECVYVVALTEPTNFLLVDQGEMPSGIYTMPLYKGTLILSTNGSGTVTTDGACEYDDATLIITGDCTITIS